LLARLGAFEWTEVLRLTTGDVSKSFESRVMDFDRLCQIVRDTRTDNVARLTEEVLLDFEERVELKLPQQFRTFLQLVGPGEFGFGRVLSPVDEGGSSEIEDELGEFRAAVQERMFSIQRLEVREPTVDLLPFARKSGRLYLFDLVGRSPADTVWTFDSLAAPADEATPTSLTFEKWVLQGVQSA
jgi:hypothetical protein